MKKHRHRRVIGNLRADCGRGYRWVVMDWDVSVPLGKLSSNRQNLLCPLRLPPVLKQCYLFHPWSFIFCFQNEGPGSLSLFYPLLGTLTRGTISFWNCEKNIFFNRNILFFVSFSWSECSYSYFVAEFLRKVCLRSVYPSCESEKIKWL